MPERLDPKTMEVWAGVRSLSSRSSDLQQQTETLRNGLTSWTAYEDIVFNQRSFDELERSLLLGIDDYPSVSDTDVRYAVSVVSDEFSWSGYAGNAPSNDSWDAYRSYLTNNGLTTVDTDEHIQLLKSLLSSDDSFGVDVTVYRDWDELSGDVSSSTIDSLRPYYRSVTYVERTIIGGGTWGEVESQFSEVGLSSSGASAAVSDFQSSFGSTLDSNVRDSFTEYDTWGTFEGYLTDVMGEDEGTTMSNKLQMEYDSYDDFRMSFFGYEASLEDVLNDSSHSGSSSSSGAGVKVWEQPGITISGQQAQPGDVSVRARNIHMEQLSRFHSDDESDLGITVSDLTASSESAYVGSEIRFTATVTKNGSGSDAVLVPLTVNGRTVDSKTLYIGDDSSRTVTFRRTFSTPKEYDVEIRDSGVVTVVIDYHSQGYGL